MLSRGGHESLAGKLLLSSALVAVSLAYGWWQRSTMTRPTPAMVPTLAPVVLHSIVPPPPRPAITAPAAVAPLTTPVPETSLATEPRGVSKQSAAPPAASNPTGVAMAAPSTPAPPQAPPQTVEAPPTPTPPAPLTAQAVEMTLMADGPSPPIPPATDLPAPGVTPSIPASAGTHLLDGDYVSDRHQLEWGDLRVKISVHGGQITGVQILQYPDHRSRSLDLSLMAGPTLESEVIKTQQAQVDAVSSATDTSYAFQDTIADAIVKAARQ